MKSVRKSEDEKQNKSIGTVFLTAEQGQTLDKLTGNGVDIPYAYFMRRAISMLPLTAEEVKPTITEPFPYRLGSTLLTADQMSRLRAYQELTGRTRSECLRDAIQCLIESVKEAQKEVIPVTIAEG